MKYVHQKGQATSLALRYISLAVRFKASVTPWSTETKTYGMLICNSIRYVVCHTFSVIGCHHHGPLARYVKLRVANAPGMPGTFSPPPRVSDTDMHYGTCVTHVPWCMTRSLTSVFLWSQCQGKRSRHSWRMHKPQFYVSDKRPMTEYLFIHSSHLIPHYMACVKSSNTKIAQQFNSFKYNT